ncbi:MAG: hypothetical protein SFV53_04285 [Rickettsiales bacterium]|nr:hypothetical protein [Rickettsiales bacterium]
MTKKNSENKNSQNKNSLAKNITKENIVKEFKPIKKLSPFVSDPYNTRGSKTNHQVSSANYSATIKGGKKMNVGSNLKKGGSGDR